MNKNLYFIVRGCQQNNADCFEEIYNRFLPLLKKYSNSFYDRDDAFDALAHSFILCLYQMPIENENFKQEVLLYLIFLQQFEIVIIHYVRRNQRL